MIVVPVLHPAFEVIATTASPLRAGAVVRSEATVTGIGGKALNVARFAAAMGAPVRAVVLGDAGFLAAVAADPLLGGPSIEVVPVHSRGKTRTDLAVVDGRGRLTVVNGTSTDVEAGALSDAMHATWDRIAAGDVIVLAGSLPPTARLVYGMLVARAREVGARSILDASGAWLTGALGAGPDVVKVNAAEARDAGVGAASAPVVVVTRGARGARWWEAGRAAGSVVPPPGLEVVNTLGAGDAVTAGLAMTLAGGGTVRDGLILGTAMAAARLRHLELTLERDDVDAFLPLVTVRSGR